MNVWPVFLRELRAESRRGVNYWLRLLGAGVLLATVVLFAINWGGFDKNSGGILFSRLNLVLFGAIWLVVPLMTADCLSREKREGTLGLLFLTSLRPGQVVLAKALVHVLRALILFLAATPVLVIPVIMGGVGWKEVLRAVLLDLGAIGLALSAGILASSWATRFNRAFILAFVISSLSGFLFITVHGLARTLQLFQTYNIQLRLTTFMSQMASFYQSRLEMVYVIVGPSGYATPVGLTAVDQVTLWLAAGLLGFSLLAAAVTMFWAARRLAKTWSGEPSSMKQAQRIAFWSRLRFGRGWLQRSNGRTLDRNPIRWLQEWSWQTRLTKWGWCLALVVIETGLLLLLPLGMFFDAQYLLAIALTLGLSFSAATSFQNERQSGAIELLLVTPIHEGQIIWGCLAGLWWMYALSVVLLSAITFGFVKDSVMAVTLVMDYLAVPVIGFYFSLTRLHYLGAWLATFVIGVVLPGGILTAIQRLAQRHAVELESFTEIMFYGGVQLALASIFGWLLMKSMQQRTFLFNHRPKPA